MIFNKHQAGKPIMDFPTPVQLAAATGCGYRPPTRSKDAGDGIVVATGGIRYGGS
jgi:hypothetical protein